jgi:hypothetical protein
MYSLNEKVDVSIPFPSEPSSRGAGADALPGAIPVAPVGGQDITIEEFQKRMVWERVTGNLPCPAGIYCFVIFCPNSFIYLYLTYSFIHVRFF